MTDAVQHITDRVRERLRVHESRGIDRAATARFVREEIRGYSERALGGALPPLADESETERSILAAITGYGRLQPYLDDPNVEEIWINRPDRVFVARDGAARLTDTVLRAEEVRDLVERMLQTTGRRVDHSSPFVDASLPDGSRLHVAIPDITRNWSVNIRKFNRSIRGLDRLVELGSLTRQAAEFLRMSVLAGMNILVCGATQSGKTTLLNALLAAARPQERIVTVEETFELNLDSEDVVAMQCRQASLEGTGEITLRRLIKEALRMRPDRLVVGEVREAESLDLLIALNSGLPGACTVHANNPDEALTKLCTLPLLAGRNIPADFIVPTVALSIDLVVHCRLDRDGGRRVTQISATTGEHHGGIVESVTLFELADDALTATTTLPPKAEKYRAHGYDPAHVLRPHDGLGVPRAMGHDEVPVTTGAVMPA